MPTAGYSSTGQTVSLAGAGGSTMGINNPKVARVEQVKSGYIVTMQNVHSYGETREITHDLEGVSTILADYFAETATN